MKNTNPFAKFTAIPKAPKKVTKKKFTRKTVEAGEAGKYSKQALAAEKMMGMSDKKEKGI
jgi:hypothetical protein